MRTLKMTLEDSDPQTGLVYKVCRILHQHEIEGITFEDLALGRAYREMKQQIKYAMEKSRQGKC